MIITTAHPAEAHTLTEIAFAAKRSWGYPDQAIVAWRSSLTITSDAIEANEFFAARMGGRIVGFGALKLDGNTLLLDHLWVLPSEMGRGVGRALFRYARERAQSRRFSTFEFESDPHASGFYERMGAEHVRTHTVLLEGTPRELPVFRCRTSNLRERNA